MRVPISHQVYSKRRYCFLDLFIFILIAFWTLPQTLLGACLYFYLNLSVGNTYYYVHRGYFSYFIFGAYSKPKKQGISLGLFGFLPGGQASSSAQIHEYGHFLQSLIFGPLYLPLIGIPLFCFNLWDDLFHKSHTLVARKEWIASRFPESWASKLGRPKDL